MLSERLVAARKRKGWKQEQLATELGVTVAAISNYERGERMPDARTLRRLASVLGVGALSWFFREPRCTIEWSGYRSTARLRAAHRAQLEAWAAERFEAFLTLQELLYPDHRCPFPDPRAVASLDEVEQAAQALRELWGCPDDPLPSLTPLVEEKGGLVIAWPETEGFDGLSGWADGCYPVAVVSNAGPPDRMRLSVAHELGHLLMRLPQEVADDWRQRERWAFRFGAALIVPADVARRELGEQRSHLTLAELVALKRTYGLSIGAWIRRAMELDIITQRTYASLCAWLGKSGLRKGEAERYPYQGDEQPRRLAQLLSRALSEGLVTGRWAQQHLPEEYAALADRASAHEPANLARELRRQPRAQRHARLQAAAADIAPLYQTDPDMTALTALDCEPFRDYHRDAEPTQG